MTLQEVLLRRGIQFRIAGTDRAKVNICCPFCTLRGKERDTKFRLCIHAREGWGRCLHCDWKHRYATAPVLKQLGIVAEVSGTEEAPVTTTEPVELPEDFQVLTHVYDDLDVQAQNYVLGRGITRTQIAVNKIGVSYAGRYAYRIVFPVYVGKDLKGINARDFTGHQTPKYLNSRGDKYLYHFDPSNETCILSEGVIKALRIAQVADCNSASLLGHDLTDIQFNQLCESKARRVILYPDVDVVGRKGTVKVADRLSETGKFTVDIVWPVALPADEAPLPNIKKSLQTVLTYTWSLRQRMLL